MKKWKRRLRRDIILAAMAVTWLCSSTHVLAEETETTKTDQNVSMLFISSYSYTWPTVPLQLEGINNIEYAQQVSEDPLVTGVIEKFSYKDNLDFARKIQPKADKIVAIVDNTVTGIGEQKQFFAQEGTYPELSFDVINGSLLTREEIIEKISEISEDTILLYLILSEDAEGNIYTNEQICHLLKENARVPVLRFVQAGIGEGVLGGNIVLHKELGEIAARMAMQMLKSTDPSEVEMQKDSPNGFYLDQKVLDRFGITDDLVPDGAEVINKEPGFWEIHGKGILITVGIAAIMMLIVILIIRAVYERRRRCGTKHGSCCSDAGDDRSESKSGRKWKDCSGNL